MHVGSKNEQKIYNPQKSKPNEKISKQTDR